MRQVSAFFLLASSMTIFLGTNATAGVAPVDPMPVQIYTRPYVPPVVIYTPPYVPPVQDYRSPYVPPVQIREPAVRRYVRPAPVIMKPPRLPPPPEGTEWKCEENNTNHDGSDWCERQADGRHKLLISEPK
jgi:hypothetical protein